MEASPDAAVKGERTSKLGLALWGAEPAYTLAEHAVLAENVGFESAWIIDSQLLCREVYVTLAACLIRTTGLRLATGVTQPTTRHPSVAASIVATLNEMAPGRMMLGLGTGFSSLRTIGKPAARIKELEEYTATLRQLLNGETVTFDQGTEGRLSWLTEAASVPIHFAASRPRMTRSAGAHGDGVILLQGTTTDLINRAIGWLDDGAALANRDPDSIEISCWVPFSQDADRRKAFDRVRARVAGALMQANPDWFEGAERDAILALQQHYNVGDHAEATPSHAALVPDSLVRKFAVAGDAQEVREKLLELRANPRVGRIILNPQIPGPGTLPISQVIRDFGDLVLPHL